MIAAVAINLALLGYYKYTNFFIRNLSTLSGVDLHIQNIILPIGISFFTFTQIAFLVDTWSGKAREYRFIHYCLFVSYFPHLVAGPIIHHGQMMPQFTSSCTYRLNWQNIAVGLTIFTIGLVKKTFFADGVAVYATPVFDAASSGAPILFFESWVGALAYTLQLYFDFSGYSDMAIGLSKMFNVKLPLNFNSPCKAVNIIEFWRRWHMTLSRFLRDYLYIPLGGNRHGSAHRYMNLVLTMLLGGLWHGGGWTFLIWGGLHGFYLATNHGWQALKKTPVFEKFIKRKTVNQSRAMARLASHLLTFFAVVIAWVFFRASNVGSATYLVKSMLGLNGFSLPESWAGNVVGTWLASHGATFQGLIPNIPQEALSAFLWISALLAIVWLFPNTQQITASYQPTSDRIESPLSPPVLRWSPTLPWASLTAILLTIGVLELNKVSEFLYFQF